MDKKLFDTLKEGDLVRHNLTGQAFVIHTVINTENPHGRVYIGVRTTDISNPDEWELVGSMHYV